MITNSYDRRILALQRGKDIPERLPVTVAIAGGFIVTFLMILIATS